MHKSMLAGFIIDCQTDDVEGAAAFWSKALGLETRKSDDPDDAEYIRLLDHQHGGLHRA
jgi:predicted enzyme related to lactoylglutathione lyase